MVRLSSSAIGLTTRIASTGLVCVLLSGCLTAGLPGRPQDVNRTVNLHITEDTEKVRSVPLKRGETIRLVFSNDSAQPHDCVVGERFVRQQRSAHIHSLHAALKSSPQGYSPDDFDTYNAVYVPPGEAKEILWWSAGPRPLELGCEVPRFAETRVAAKPKQHRRKAATTTANASRVNSAAIAAVRPVAKPLPPAQKKLEPAEKTELPPRAPSNRAADRHPPETVEATTPVQSIP